MSAPLSHREPRATTPRLKRRGNPLLTPALFLASWAVGSLAMSQVPPAGAGLSPEQRMRIDAVFTAYDRQDSPGCALGVMRNGSFLYQRGYGMANLEYGIPLSADSVFRIGSTSKQFAAFAILLLEQDGKLAASDDVRQWIPELQPQTPPVRIEHLIHHTSGSRDYLTLMSLRGERDLDYYTDAEVIDLLARQRELNFTPGSEWLYSNSGYFLLSVLVQRASGLTLAEFARQRIFEPLDMRDTHFHDDSKRIVPRRASGYAPTADGFEISQTTLPMVGDGGVFTTTNDLLEWEQSFSTHELLNETLRKRQLTPATLSDGRATDYAYGLFISQYRGLPTIQHGGAFVGYRAEFLRFPEQRVGISVLCNLSSADPSRLARQVADVVLQDLLSEADGKSSEPEPSTRDNLNTQRVLAAATASASLRELEPWLGAWHDPSDRSENLWFVRHAPGLDREPGSLTVDAGWLGVLQLEPVRVGARGDEPGTLALRSQGPERLILEFSASTGGTTLRATSSTYGLTTELERAAVVTPPLDALRRAIGRFYCPELDVSYLLEVDDEELWAHLDDRHRDFFDGPLHPGLHPDRFHTGNLTFDLERDSAGRVERFRLGAGRVKNLLCERRPE